MTALDFEALAVGEEYGPLDYVLTEEKLATFRRVVGDEGAVFPTIAAKDYSNLFKLKHPGVSFINAKHESWYRSPPAAGEKITASGTLVDTYVRRGRAYLVMETRSVGEDGRELVRARTTLVVRGYTPKSES